MIVFKILWTIDALASLVILYFFLVGLGDGTVSSRNMGLWIVIVAALTGIILGSVWLRNHQHLMMANGLLMILALPVFLYGIYILIAMFGNQRWN